MKKIFIPMMLLILAAGCGRVEKQKFSMVAAFSSEGPFMEGVPESFQFQAAEAIGAELKKLGISAAQIKGVKLTKAQLKTADSAKFDDFGTCTLSMLSEGKEKAKTMAVKNPLDKGKSEIELQVSADADLAGHFQSAGPIFLLDLNALKDRENPFNTEIGMEFEIEFKK